MRFDIQFQTIKKVENHNRKQNDGRLPFYFKINDLILTQNTPADLTYIAHSAGEGQKLLPHRLLSCRVLFNGEKRAIVQNILMQVIREVHLQDIQFIGIFRGDRQRRMGENTY